MVHHQSSTTSRYFHLVDVSELQLKALPTFLLSFFLCISGIQLLDISPIPYNSYMLPPKNLKLDITLYFYKIFKSTHSMISKSLNSMRLLSFSCRQHFGITFLDDKYYPPPFDVLITDINSDDLDGDISKKLGKKYLSCLSSQENEFKKIRKGILYGQYHRGMISLPTRFNNHEPRWVHYLVNPGSPSIFLTAKVLQTLTGKKKI